ncbi:hypothetical protein GQ600_4542 [Phytophthora cactorum]|nr:hypothetical protein GQ600_4542 [Phytophthora cactorum]
MKNDVDGGVNVAIGGKRRRNGEEEDLGSQQSILKWMRHVPGPLQDVMKNAQTSACCIDTYYNN